MQYPEPIAKLIASYMKLPGVGEKTATRLAFYTIGMDEDDVKDFSRALVFVETLPKTIHAQFVRIRGATKRPLWW